MSRIGRKPIAIPAGVTVTVNSGNVVAVKGPKGELSERIHADIKVNVDGAVVTVERPSDDKDHRALHGLSRTLIANMVEGVSNGFSKTLDIVGVGYRVAMQGTTLVMNMGFSHQVEMPAPAGITFEAPTQTRVIVKGASKQLVGETAAKVRGVRPPEPYKGKGIRYENEFVRRKVGKTGK